MSLDKKGGHHPHDHAHPHCETHHHHGIKHAESSLLSRKERLIRRLEHDLRHNHDHAASYGKLAEEAEQLGQAHVARMICAAAEYTARQNEQLEKALSRLKSDPVM